MTNTTNEMWSQKEKRELFCKTINSILMRCGEDKLPNIEPILGIAKKVVDMAFVNYPSPEDEAEPTNLEFKK